MIFRFPFVCFYKIGGATNLRGSGTSFKDICRILIYHPKNLKCNVKQVLSKSTLRSFSKSKKPGGILLGLLFTAPILFTNDEKGEHLKEKNIFIKEDKKQLKRGIIAQYALFIYEKLRIILRLFRLVATFSPILILYPITLLGLRGEELWWKLLLTAIEWSGPIFTKFGQWASTRRDLFSPRFCHQFSKLQHRATPHSWQYTKHIMKKTFGKNWRKAFVKIDNDWKPIGSGAVAQVYKVWMPTIYVPSEEMIAEIMSNEGDEDDVYVSDGLEVLGFEFKKIFSLGKNKEDSDEENNAIKEWRKEWDEKKNGMNPNENNWIDTDGLFSLAKRNISNFLRIGTNDDDEQLSVSNDTLDKDESIIDEENLLYEQWNDSIEVLDKTLPLSDSYIEGCNEDLEGLVPVALKILHPGVFRLFRRDLAIIKFGASFISTFYPPLQWLSLEKCVKEFSDVMMRQLDLRVEAENLEKFDEHFSGCETVKFPHPIRPFVKRNVLVETFEEGEFMINFVVNEGHEGVKNSLAQIGVDAIMKMIFVDNFVHADLHPGNILVQNFSEKKSEQIMNNVSGDENRLMMVDVGCDTFVLDVIPDPTPLKICILDCGLTSSLTVENLKKLKEVFEMVVLGRGENVADLFLKHSEHYCPDEDAFRSEMKDLIEKARENSISLGQVDVGLLLQGFCSLLMNHRVRLEAAFSSVILAVLVMEGLGRSLDNSMDILERARPLLITAIKV